MNKTILIAPFDGPLAAALAEAAKGGDWHVALAVSPRATPPKAGGPKREEAPAQAPEAPAENRGAAGAVVLPYDPASYVSASALVTAASNALGEIETAVIVAGPQAGLADLFACKPGEIGALVGARCAGPLYLVRELARRFEARKSGRILLMTSERPKDAVPGPAAALVEGAFEGLGLGLFAQTAGASWSAFGLIDASGQPERAARYALSLLEDPKASKAGRWLRYTGKNGLFGTF